jgi:hypothetical protein
MRPIRASAYGQSDLNCLLEYAGGPAARQISIPEPVFWVTPRSSSVVTRSLSENIVRNEGNGCN